MGKRIWFAAVILVVLTTLTSWRALARASEAPPVVDDTTDEIKAAPPALAPLPAKLAINKSIEPQRVTLTGKGLVPGLSVRMETPGGDYVVTFGPHALTVNGGAIELTTEFSEPGTYRFYAVNPDRQRSNPVTLRVR